MKKTLDEKKTPNSDLSKLLSKLSVSSAEAFHEWSWVSEKYLTSVDENYVMDLKEIHSKPDDTFDGPAHADEKTRSIKLWITWEERCRW